jgi:hypothetical protein
MFLSVQEIMRLTGKKRPSAQIAWLKAHAYRFNVNGLKQPIVAVAESYRKLVGGSAPVRQQEPNWEAMYG